jgi:hypothetical protein
MNREQIEKGLRFGDPSAAVFYAANDEDGLVGVAGDEGPKNGVRLDDLVFANLRAGNDLQPVELMVRKKDRTGHAHRLRAPW